MTEQDVVNEEMYEEEDDDLPMQYRRLTAHLSTGNADFNRRLSAYLTGQIATRTALDQVIAQSLCNQYPNASQFAQHSPFAAPYPSPFGAVPMMPPSFQQTPGAIPHSPYPTPSVQAFDPTNPQSAINLPGNFQQQQQQQQQSQQANFPMQSPLTADFSDPKSSLNMVQPDQSSSMASTAPSQIQMPTVSPHSGEQLPISIPSNNSRQQPAQSESNQTPVSAQVQASRSIAHDKNPHQTPQPQQNTIAPYPCQMNAGYGLNPNPYGFGPYNPALPTESQLLVGSALNSTDPFTAALLAGSSSSLSVPFYSYNPPNTSNSASTSTTGQAKLKDLHPTYDSLTQTLAPSALEITPTAGAKMTPMTKATTLPLKGEVLASPVPTAETSLGPDVGFEELFGGISQEVRKFDAGQGTGGLEGGSCTPGTERDLWSNFIDGTAWDEAVS